MGEVYDKEALRVCKLLYFDTPCTNAKGYPIETDYIVPVKITYVKRESAKKRNYFWKR